MPRKPKRRSRKPGLRVTVGGGSVGHLNRQSAAFRAHYDEMIERHVLEPVANRVQLLARAYAPRRSGFLSDTIEIRRSKTKNKITYRVRPNYRRYRGYYYAAVQEFGSKVRRIRARWYMRRARQSVKGLFALLMRKGTNQAIRTYRPEQERVVG